MIADPATRAIGEALRTEAIAAGADGVLALMDAARDRRHRAAASDRGRDGRHATSYIAPTSRSLSHTVARKCASERGVRGATMPGVTDDMLARVMAVDFDAMAARSHAVAALLDEASCARLTCPRGTDFTLDLTARPGIADDGDLTDPGAFGNLPCGEASSRRRKERAKSSPSAWRRSGSAASRRR